MKRSRWRLDAARGALLSVLLIFPTSWTLAADRIFLRNGEIVGDRSIVSFDADSVRLDNGASLGWHEIMEARVANNQAAFNSRLEQLGEHLFRIRQRLRVGDYRDILRHAEPLYPIYVKRQSQTAYTVLQALMWGRLAIGQREQALEPYLRCYALLRGRHAALNQLPGSRRLRVDPQTGLTDELLPVWFDAEAARRVSPQVEATIRAMKPRPPGALVYFSALALAVGDTPKAVRVLALVESTSPPLADFRQILLAQAEVMAARPGSALAQLSSRLPEIAASRQPLALYWLGMSKLADQAAATRQLGVLDLLRIPAIYGEQYPELAAAALFQTMNELRESGDALGSVSVRNELLIRYGQTSFADRAKTPTDTTP